MPHDFHNQRPLLESLIMFCRAFSMEDEDNVEEECTSCSDEVQKLPF
jgi:hypothetical protein